MQEPASEASYAWDAANSAQRKANHNANVLEELEDRVKILETYVDYLAYVLSEVGDLSLERDVLDRIQARAERAFPAVAGNELIGYADED